MMESEHYIPQKGGGWGWECYVPLNNYESPYITPTSMEYKIFRNRKEEKPIGIKLNEKKQIGMLDNFREYYKEFYRDINEKSDKLRYKADNGYFDECDAALLYSMLRGFMSRKYIEIGSGYSTALALDVKEMYLKDTEVTCIEPYPDRLLKNIKNENEVILYKNFVQEVAGDIFEQLEQDDILFIDSSHVAKLGGDVPFEYFEILPRLKKGVIIHIHDIFYPFTYPEYWVKQGRCYNEAFIVHALLMDNKNYEILFWNDMMTKLHYKDYFQICNNPGGGSLWLQKK